MTKGASKSGKLYWMWQSTLMYMSHYYSSDGTKAGPVHHIWHSSSCWVGPLHLCETNTFNYPHYMLLTIWLDPPQLPCVPESHRCPWGASADNQLFAEQGRDGGSGWLHSCLLAWDHRLCTHKEQKQSLPSSPRSALQHEILNAAAWFVL